MNSIANPCYFVGVVLPDPLPAGPDLEMDPYESAIHNAGCRPPPGFRSSKSLLLDRPEMEDYLTRGHTPTGNVKSVRYMPFPVGVGVLVSAHVCREPHQVHSRQGMM